MFSYLRLSVLIALVGCAPDDYRVKSAFPMGHPIAVAEPKPNMRPVMTIMEPGNPITLRPYQRFYCLVRLTVTEGDRLPGTIIALIQTAKGDAGSFALRPKEKENDTYFFHGEGISPAAPQTYSLVIQAAYFLEEVSRTDLQNTNASAVKYKPFYVNSPPVTITVRQ